MTRIERIKSRFWWWWLRQVPITKSKGSVGNRFIEVTMIGPLEVTITCRDTRREDGYSREELYSMLRLIRKEEVRHEWKVPEPEGHHGAS